MTACSTFSKTLELPGLWRRRLAQVSLDPWTHATLDRELVTRELRRLYVDAVSDVRYVTVSTCAFRAETGMDCKTSGMDEGQMLYYMTMALSCTFTMSLSAVLIPFNFALII